MLQNLLQPPNSMFSWATFFAGAAGAFMAHFVAKFVDRQFLIGVEVERRKDEDLTAFCQSIDVIQDSCVEMWLQSPKALGIRDIELQAKITGNLKLLSLINSELFRYDIEKKDANKKFIGKLIRVASGKDFGDPDRQIDNGIVVGITEKTMRLKHQVRLSRRSLPRHWLG